MGHASFSSAEFGHALQLVSSRSLEGFCEKAMHQGRAKRKIFRPSQRNLHLDINFSNSKVLHTYLYTSKRCRLLSCANGQNLKLYRRRLSPFRAGFRILLKNESFLTKLQLASFWFVVSVRTGIFFL